MDFDAGGAFSQDGKPKHHTFTQQTASYFKELKEKMSPAEEELSLTPDSEKIVSTKDGWKFDHASVRAALSFCKNLQIFLEAQTEAEFAKLQKISSFYRKPKEMHEQIKILFAGRVEAKERITRIYAAKAIGTYKVIKTMLNTPELYYELSAEQAQQIRQELKQQAEGALKKVMSMIPKSRFASLPQDQDPLKNICQILSQKQPLFHKGHPYGQITKRFRELIFWLKASPGLPTYLEWKQKYLKYWLYTELHFLDEQNLASKKHPLPHYAMLKIINYQELETLFAELEVHERQYHHLYDLKKQHYECLGRPEFYLPSSSNKEEMKRARKAERDLLNSLTLNQLSTLFAAVHASIVRAIRQDRLPGILPSGINSRSLDWDTEEKADKKYMADTVSAQEDLAQAGKGKMSKDRRS